MKKMKIYSLDEVKDELLGPVGTLKRDSFEKELKKELYEEEYIEYCSKCGKEQRETIRTCPYKTEKHNDEESLCNCCDSCYRKCLGYMEEDFTKIGHCLRQYLGAESIDSVDIMCFVDVTYIFVDAVYTQSTELYPDQLIKYSLKFETDFNKIKILNPNRAEQWDMKTNQPVKWSSWWLDELVTRDKKVEEELLLALLEYYYSE